MLVAWRQRVAQKPMTVTSRNSAMSTKSAV